jgi:hypothetical protein
MRALSKPNKNGKIMFLFFSKQNIKKSKITIAKDCLGELTDKKI